MTTQISQITPKIHTRPITPSDDPAIAAIVRCNLEKYHLNLPGTVYFDPELNHLSRFYSSKPGKRAYFVAEDERGQIIGGVGIAEFTGFEDCAELQKLYLTDAAKGHGMGRRLLWLAQEWAVKCGYRRLYLETHSNLEAAIKLYEKNGFHQIEKPAAVVHNTMNQFYIKELDVENQAEA